MHAKQSLGDLGWDERFAADFEPHAARGLRPGRVAVEHRGAYVLLTERGELRAETSGSLRHRAGGQSQLPAVGDWVAADLRLDDGSATIRAILPRRTCFSRNVAGLPMREQVLAANLDVTFLVSALDADLNVRRLERYLTMAWASGATPVVVLNKADLCGGAVQAPADVRSVASGVSIHVTSAITGQGVDELRTYLEGHRTAAVLGSSGVGKSTLVNALCASAVQIVRAVRDDGRGRHTTTRRELVAVEGGGLLIDTPGLRELQLWDDDEGLDETFADIGELAQSCRFRDCRHEHEPDCAVVQAVADGALDRGRYESFRKLERELHHLRVKRDRRAAAVERRKWRTIAKDHRRTRSQR